MFDARECPGNFLFKCLSLLLWQLLILGSRTQYLNTFLILAFIPRARTALGCGKSVGGRRDPQVQVLAAKLDNQIGAISSHLVEGESQLPTLVS